MSVYDLTLMDEVLKEEYAPAVVEQFKRQNILYDMLREGDKGMIKGRHLYIPIELSRNPTGGPGAETAAYPDAGQPEFEHFEVNTSIYRNLFEISTAAVEDSAAPSDAFLQSAEKAILDGTNGVKTALGRDVYGSRYSVLATVASNVTVTITVDDAFTAHGDELLGTRRILKRQKVNFVDPATGTLRVGAVATTGVFTVVSTTSTTVFVVDDEPIGLTANDICVPVGATSATVAGLAAAPAGYGIYGLLEIIDNGTGVYSGLFADYGNLDRSSLAGNELDSIVMNKAAGALANTDLENAVQAALMASGDLLTPQNGVLAMHPAVRQLVKFWRYNDVRFAPTEARQGIDNKMLSYNAGDGDFPIYADRMATPQTIFGLNLDYLNYWETVPISMDEHDGGVLKVKRGSTGAPYDILQGMLRWRGQVFCSKPNSCFKIHNFSGTDPQFGMGTSFVHSA